VTIAVRKDLGDNLDLEEFTVGQGSIELILVVTAIYKFVKNLNESVENIQQATEHLRTIIRGLLPGRAPNAIDRYHVTASGQPGSALVAASSEQMDHFTWGITGLSANSLLMVYLILSNVALITGLLVFLALKAS
jgi:hypothetical protein